MNQLALSQYKANTWLMYRLNVGRYISVKWPYLQWTWSSFLYCGNLIWHMKKNYITVHLKIFPTSVEVLMLINLSFRAVLFIKWFQKTSIPIPVTPFWNSGGGFCNWYSDGKGANYSWNFKGMGVQIEIWTNFWQLQKTEYRTSISQSCVHIHLKKKIVKTWAVQALETLLKSTVFIKALVWSQCNFIHEVTGLRVGAFCWLPVHGLPQWSTWMVYPWTTLTGPPGNLWQT